MPVTVTQPETRLSTATRPYVWMALVALLVRLAVIPFVYHDWMDPFVLEHWAFGLIARSIASGHGFGSPFADTGASALLPPVYSYLLAGIFKVFGIETKSSILAALSLNSFFSALTCIPVYMLCETSPRRAGGKMGRMGLGFLPLRHLLRRRLGVVHMPGHVGACLPLPLRMGTGELPPHARLGWVRPTGRFRCSDRASHSLGGASARAMDPLSQIPFKAPVETAHVRRGFGSARHYEPLADSQLRALSSLHPVRSGFGLELYIGNNGYSERWVNSSLHPNHSDAELSEYERVGEMAYMDHKLRQAKDYIRSHPAWFARMTFRRMLYMWTGYWSFDRNYLRDEPLDPPNILVNTTLTVLGFVGLGRLYNRDSGLATRFTIVLLFFP